MLERLRFRLTGSVLFWDTLLTLAALHIAATVRLRIDLGQDLTTTSARLPWQIYPAVAVVWIVIFLLLTPQRALFARGMVEAIGRLLAAVALASTTFAGVLYLSFRDVSRLQFLYFVVIDLVLLLIAHLIIRSYWQYRLRTSWHRRVLFVGEGEQGLQLAQEMQRRRWAGLTVLGYTGDKVNTTSEFPCLGALEDTVHVVKQQQIDEVIFALPPQQYDTVARISLQLQQEPVMLHMLPGVLDLAFARTPVASLGGIPLISLRESALTEPQRLLKRFFDSVASLGLLLLLSPILIIIAILIKLESPGPVFFLQERIGEHGRRFKMIKFRSMYVDADKRWREVARRDESGRLIHKMHNDPRVTRIGRKLRRTSLDELPQLFNVLRGEMSLVGPRPEMPYIAAEYEPWQWQRFRVPPGITGWWQVNGRSDKPMHLHTEDDLYYIQNYSFWLDLRILFKTVSVVFGGNGAY
jgi:exopolysaccharide biosynthesis polyprenyl glycosylphosphotransferase